MNHKIAELLRDEIDGLSFAERTAGLVRSMPIKIPTEDGAMIIKNLPIGFNNETPCESEDGMYLIPDSSKKSIIFFEDGGISITTRDSRYIHCKSTLTMVAWFNLPMINTDYTDATLLMAQLIQAIPKYLTNTDFVTRLMVTIGAFMPKDTVYANYDLDLAENAYFAFPYDYAAVQINTRFAIARNCLDAVVIDPTACP